MSDEAISVLDVKFWLLMEKMGERAEDRFIYFKPDEKKAGEAYTEIGGKVKNVDEIERTIRLEDEMKISMNDGDMEGRIFSIL